MLSDQLRSLCVLILGFFSHRNLNFLFCHPLQLMDPIRAKFDESPELQELLRTAYPEAVKSEQRSTYRDVLPFFRVHVLV